MRVRRLLRDRHVRRRAGVTRTRREHGGAPRQDEAVAARAGAREVRHGKRRVFTVHRRRGERFGHPGRGLGGAVRRAAGSRRVRAQGRADRADGTGGQRAAVSVPTRVFVRGVSEGAAHTPQGD